AAGRGPGRARVRDDLSLLDLLSVVDLELRVVVVRRRDRTAVALAVGDDDPVAVAAGPPGGDDDPVAGRADRSSAGHAEVHAGVQLLRAGDRVGPVAEGGGRRIALGRVGQDSVAEVELALLLLLLLPFADLLRQPVLLFLLLGQLLLGLGLVVGDRLLRLVLRRDQVVEV